MKSNKQIGWFAALAAALSIGNGFARVPQDWDGRRQRKHGGGKGGTRRINSPRYRAWRKAFGGLAVPSYSE